jgi:hypothetical protein
MLTGMYEQTCEFTTLSSGFEHRRDLHKIRPRANDKKDFLLDHFEINNSLPANAGSEEIGILKAGFSLPQE